MLLNLGKYSGNNPALVGEVNCTKFVPQCSCICSTQVEKATVAMPAVFVRLLESCGPAFPPGAALLSFSSINSYSFQGHVIR